MSNLSNHFLISPNAECVVPEINVSSLIKLLHRGWERPPAQNAWTLFIILHYQKIVISQKQPSQSANTSSLVWLARQSKDSHVSIRGHLRLRGGRPRPRQLGDPCGDYEMSNSRLKKKSNKMLNNVHVTILHVMTWLKVRLQDKPGLTQYSGSVWWHVGGSEARRPQKV